MKTYIINFLIETESNTQGETLAVCSDLKTAQKEFKKAVKLAPRYRQSNEDDFREYVTESIVLELGEDVEPEGDFVNDGNDYQLLDYVFHPFNTNEGFTNIEVRDFDDDLLGEIAGLEIPDEYDKEEVIKFEEILKVWLKGENLL